MIGQHIHVEEASIGEWDDESPLSLTPLTQYDVFVNAWMPLPEPYREVE